MGSQLMKSSFGQVALNFVRLHRRVLRGYFIGIPYLKSTAFEPASDLDVSIPRLPKDAVVRIYLIHFIDELELQILTVLESHVAFLIQ